MIAAIDAVRGPGRRLERLILPELSEAEKALADNAVLDPEHPDDLLEPFSSPGLFTKARWLRKPR